MTKKTNQPGGAKRHSLKFFVVSYAPTASSEQSVNIAVVIVGDGFADVRFVPNWERVMALDPEADIELLTALASEIRDDLRAADQREDALHRMQDSWSNTIRVSPSKGCLTDNPATEIEILASQYLK